MMCIQPVERCTPVQRRFGVAFLKGWRLWFFVGGFRALVLTRYRSRSRSHWFKTGNGNGNGNGNGLAPVALGTNIPLNHANLPSQCLITSYALFNVLTGVKQGGMGPIEIRA